MRGHARRGATLSERADIAIVGAGVMGTSIAWHLARRGAGRICVLDQSHAGTGASGASSALVRMHYAYEPEVRLARLGLQYFENWPDLLGRPSSFRRTGYVRIVEPAQAEHLRANVAMQQRCGVNARLISGDELHELEPGWNCDDVEVAAYEPDSGYGDGATVANDFLDGARERGVEYRPRCAVSALEIEGGRVRALETAAGRIEVERAIVAGGAWSRRLLADAGIDLPLVSEYHEVAVLQRPRSDARLHTACGDSRQRTYSRTEGETQTLVGTFEGTRTPDPDPGRRSGPTESVVDQVMRAARRMPVLSEAGLVRAVGGYYTMTPDTRALLGPVPEVEGLHCCTGFSGMGFKLSPAIGLVMSEWLLDGAPQSVDVSEFAVDRFARGRPIRPEHEYV